MSNRASAVVYRTLLQIALKGDFGRRIHGKAGSDFAQYLYLIFLAAGSMVIG